MTGALKSELENALRDVITRMDSSFTVKEAVAEVQAQYADLYQRTSNVLATDYLREMASRILRRVDATTRSGQLALPGFEHLPKLIRCGGQYIAIEDANLDQLQAFKSWYDSRLAVLLKRTEKFRQTGKELARLIQLVERFSDSNPAITVRTVMVLRAERQAARAKLTPEQRKEIARQGSVSRWRRDGES